MRRSLLQIAALCFICLFATLARGGETIDGVVATVNGVPLLQSDVDDALRFEAFLQQRSVALLTAGDREFAFQRLIDRELLRQEMPTDFAIAPEEVSRQLANVRSQFSGAETADAWIRILASYGLTEQTVNERVSDQLRVLAFIDLRLRAAVRIDDDAVAAYYNETLVPKLKQMNAPVDPLASVSSKIEQLLVQKRMDELLAIWIANLRSQSQISVMGGPQNSESTHSRKISSTLARTESK